LLAVGDKHEEGMKVKLRNSHPYQTLQIFTNDWLQRESNFPKNISREIEAPGSGSGDEQASGEDREEDRDEAGDRDIDRDKDGDGDKDSNRSGDGDELKDGKKKCKPEEMTSTVPSEPKHNSASLESSSTGNASEGLLGQDSKLGLDPGQDSSGRFLNDKAVQKVPHRSLEWAIKLYLHVHV